jgi:hypothetical protein
MRNGWGPLEPDGTYVRITCGRSPQWVAENRDNPLRCWDGREHITGAQYRKAVSQYKATRRAIVAALAEEDTQAVEDRLTQAGREYPEAFNTLSSRTHFIETMEREELFDALEVLVKGLADHTTLDLALVIEAVEDGMDQTRNWLRQPAKAAAATAPVRTRPQHPAQTPDFLPTRDAISAQVRQRMGRATSPTHTAGIARFLSSLVRSLAEDKRLELLRVSPTRFPILLLAVRHRSGPYVTRYDGTERTFPAAAERPRMRRN